MLGHRFHFPRRRDVRQDDRELVPTEASHRVALAHALLQSCGGLLQDLVAFGVTEAVVDSLEVVEVDEEHAELPRLPLCPRKRRARAGP